MLQNEILSCEVQQRVIFPFYKNRPLWQDQKQKQYEKLHLQFPQISLKEIIDCPIYNLEDSNRPVDALHVAN